MTQKIVVGPIDKGIRTDRTAFVIDNDSFPKLVNAYQWRGRIKRKRGTSLINRLTRYFNSNSTAYSSTTTIPLVSGAINLFTGFSLQATGNIIPGSVTIVDTTSSTTYTDNSVGILVGGSGGTINYATGAITITGGATNSISAVFRYYPDLPVMGLEAFSSILSQFPGTIAFDTVYSYNIKPTPNSGLPSSFPIYDVSFYKNPPTLDTYTHKDVPTPTSWNGSNYQQFWTVNYQGAMWTTNGVQQFPSNQVANIGMQFAPASTITYTSNTATTITLNVTNCPLVVGDFVFFNEWTGTNASYLNLQTGYVTSANPDTPPFATKDLVITLPEATLPDDTYTPGILQYLTNRSNPAKDCLRWYDGDPTNGSDTSPVLNGNLGWVNFMPPLSSDIFNVGLLPSAKYYLVGAQIIFPFKDRLVFFGPVVQTSKDGAVPIYLQDTIIFSQNGTAFYTCSFPGNEPLLPTTVFTPLLVPSGEGATAPSWFEDSFGFGGYLTVGVDQPMTTVSNNEDVLIVGFPKLQTRMVYTGNDGLPFNFYIINSELGTYSTFSAVNLDRGVITVGQNGISITSQTAAARIDLDLPDQIFQFNISNNGPQRVSSQRDFINEWIYMSYTSNLLPDVTFPNETLQYNYRDSSWATFSESYTTYGQFKAQGGFTWNNVPFSTWEDWSEPWNAGGFTANQPQVIAGNQQGFVLMRDQGTTESVSLYITSIINSVINSPNHGLNEGDFIVISGCIGTITVKLNDIVYPINGTPFQIDLIDTNNFSIGGTITGNYIGGGLIKRMYVPQILTKQFPTAWGISRKTRLGPQQYLFSTTPNGQITLLIFLSQNSSDPYNSDLIVPDPNSPNDALVYSNILYTCPESTNLGLTPFTSNLNTPTASAQEQLWHRMNTGLIGDTVQIGFTMSTAQMLDPEFNNQFEEIELHSMILEVAPSQLLV